MIPATFDYIRATSVDEAVGAMAEHGDEAKVLAGGHSLLPMMKLRLAVPEFLVDVGRVEELHGVREDGDHLVDRGGDHPPPGHDRRAGPPALRRPGRRHRDHRRRAGPPPRHHRRWDRARRPGR